MPELIKFRCILYCSKANTIKSAVSTNSSPFALKDNTDAKRLPMTEPTTQYN